MERTVNALVASPERERVQQLVRHRAACLIQSWWRDCLIASSGLFLPEANLNWIARGFWPLEAQYTCGSVPAATATLTLFLMHGVTVPLMPKGMPLSVLLCGPLPGASKFGGYDAWFA